MDKHNTMGVNNDHLNLENSLMEERRKFDDELKEEMRDFLLQALQTGKAETSGLVQDIFRQMDQHIETSVKKHVNGNISDMKKQINDYIKSDDVWKVRAEPALKACENTTLVGNFLRRLTIGLLKFLVLIGASVGAWIAIKEFFKK